jgi:hypothetical protein
MVETGWEPDQVGHKTLDQLLAVLTGIRKRSEMMWGKGEDKKMESGKEKTVGLDSIEQHLKMLREKTGRTTFDLREVL